MLDRKVPVRGFSGVSCFASHLDVFGIVWHSNDQWSMCYFKRSMLMSQPLGDVLSKHRLSTLCMNFSIKVIESPMNPNSFIQSFIFNQTIAVHNLPGTWSPELYILVALLVIRNPECTPWLRESHVLSTGISCRLEKADSTDGFILSIAEVRVLWNRSILSWRGSRIIF